MSNKILVANRADSGRRAVAAEPERVVRHAHAGPLVPIEAKHV